MKGVSMSALTAALSLFSESVEGQLVGIPTTPFNRSGDDVYPLHRVKHLIVDSRFAQNRDTSGLTLIPPTLHDFASTFAQDLSDTVGVHPIIVEGSDRGDKDTIFLTLSDDNGVYLDAAGRSTPEGYTITTDTSGIIVSGASPLGAWWGTRTILQQAQLLGGAPVGTGVDAPDWGERGMMLDCGRHFYPKQFLIDMCGYMSFFKQNTFHIHLSDNIITSRYEPDNYQDLYARFRLWSPSETVKGLNKFHNESYTREDFDDIQRKCVARGVTVLPEIEAPGHALPIVQWRPQIGYQGDLSLLNISHPDTIPTMQTIWKEFLPWFHSKVVSIGADEYKGPEDDYKKYVQAMDTFIQRESNKTIRIWGTFPPKDGEPTADEISTDVSIQHWSFSFDNPLNDYLKNNYTVINSDEMYYVVLKCCAYGQRVNIAETFSGDPSDRGPWYPNIFSTSTVANNAPRDEPLIHGAIAPLWNDRGANTSVYSEAYYAWQDGIPALADKQWGGSLTESQFADIFPKLHGRVVPAQNLERIVPSQGSTIFKYDLSRQQSGSIKDLSGNNYTAKSSCRTKGSSVHITPECSVTTPIGSKGRNYTLSLTAKIDKLDHPTNTTLITGTDSMLVLTPNITLFAAGNYFRLDIEIPLGEWVTVRVIGRGEQTFASLESDSGGSTGEKEFQAGITQGDAAGTVKLFPIAIEAPIQEVAGWTGELRSISLTSEV